MIRTRDYERNGMLLVLASPLALIMLAGVATAWFFWPQVEDWFALTCPQLNAAIASIHPQG